MKQNILCILAMALLAAIGCSNGKFSPSSLPGPFSRLIPGQAEHVETAEHVGSAAGHLKTAHDLSEDDEDELGQSVGISLTNRYRLVKNGALTKYVTLVGLTVASTSQRPDITYVFGILDTPEINAFSGPNGYVFITKGALKNMQDEAELAGVLAHEESHVILHHGLDQVRAAEQRAAISEVVKTTPVARFSVFADLAVDAITKTGYSQPQEFDADSAAIDLLAAAKYNPGSYLNFLVRLQQIQPANGAGGIMSTHPGTADRVANVKHVLMNVSSVGATLPDRFHKNVKF